MFFKKPDCSSVNEEADTRTQLPPVRLDTEALQNAKSVPPLLTLALEKTLISVFHCWGLYPGASF